ncbi:hypothetical protein C8R43DRAFT_1155221 [Mycena crocata]|nr:hypothetical protein C8R43DRAFT_1155221 [Mycena crocata]
MSILAAADGTASLPAPAVVSPSYAQIFGPVFWGFCVALILCGVSALQGYLYFTRYNDKWGVRALAAMMLLLDFISMALISQSMYYYMLPQFGSFAPLNHVTRCVPSCVTFLLFWSASFLNLFLSRGGSLSIFLVRARSEGDVGGMCSAASDPGSTRLALDRPERSSLLGSGPAFLNYVRIGSCLVTPCTTNSTMAASFSRDTKCLRRDPLLDRDTLSLRRHTVSVLLRCLILSELSIECLISAIITFTSQMYFVYQLHMVKSTGMTGRVMSGVVVLLGMVGLAGAVGCVGMMFSVPHVIFTNRNHTFAILAGVAKGFGAAADIVATITMCLFLRGAGTGISRTSSLLHSLMHLVINRGILITAAQILLLITFFATAGHLYWLAVHINTTKLYVNTFFGMLNARAALTDRYTTGHMSLSAETATAGSSSYPVTLYSGSFPNNSPYPSYAPGSPGSAHLAKSAKGDRQSVGFQLAREKAGSFETQEYALSSIRVTTSSTVADI